MNYDKSLNLKMFGGKLTKHNLQIAATHILISVRTIFYTGNLMRTVGFFTSEASEKKSLNPTF